MHQNVVGMEGEFICPLYLEGNHTEERSLCAFLSYTIYHQAYDDVLVGQPQRVACKCDHIEHILLPESNPHQADIANWAIYHKAGTLYLVFRGTANRSDQVVDVAVTPFNVSFGDVEFSLHMGFWGAVTNAYSLITKHILHFANKNINKLVITGHSLGGALAQLFALKYYYDVTRSDEWPEIASVITFAAPQSCIDDLSVFFPLQNKCINYVCVDDPVPCLASFVDHQYSGRFLRNIAMNTSFVAALFTKQFNSLRLAMAPVAYLKNYHSFVNSVALSPRIAALCHQTPKEHHAYIQQLDEQLVDHLNTDSHSMLFYLGEMKTLQLFSTHVATWFDEENKRVAVKRYCEVQRRLIYVNRTWMQWLYEIAEPLLVIVFSGRVLMLQEYEELLPYATRVGQGSTYIFIDPNTNAAKIDELKTKCRAMIKDDIQVSIYEAGDFSWIERASDIGHLIKTFRPLVFWERNAAALDHFEGRDLRAKDKNGKNAFEAAADILTKEVNENSSIARLANALIATQSPINDKMESINITHDVATGPRLVSPWNGATDRLTPSKEQFALNYVSICAILTLRATKQCKHHDIKLENTLYFESSGKEWATYTCNETLFVVFHAEFDSDFGCLESKETKRLPEPLLEYTVTRDIDRIYSSDDMSPLLKNPTMAICATGFAYGGALAQALASRLQQTSDVNVASITFGAPPIAKKRQIADSITNYVRYNDPVPHLNDRSLSVKKGRWNIYDQDDKQHKMVLLRLVAKCRKMDKLYNLGTIVHLSSDHTVRFLKTKSKSSHFELKDSKSKICVSMYDYCAFLSRDNLLSDDAQIWIAGFKDRVTCPPVSPQVGMGTNFFSWSWFSFGISRPVRIAPEILEDDDE